MRDFKNNYKYFNHFLLWSVVIILICLPTAGKVIDFAGYPISITVLYFPILCVLADIIAEVYGYAAARYITFYTVLAQVVTAFVFQVVAYYPPAGNFVNNDAFITVLTTAPLVVIGGTAAVYLGEMSNNYVLAKMKVHFGGKYMGLRFMLSTVVGQFVNTSIFFVFGLWGVLPWNTMVESILVATTAKIIVEGIMLPVSTALAKRLKKAEGVDHFDVKTNFSFFRI